MSKSLLQSVVQEIAGKLAKGEYEAVVAQCHKSRLTARAMRAAIDEYGRTLVPPPADAYAELDAISIQPSAIPSWSVHAPLWNKEEGRSDLTMELTIGIGVDGTIIEFDDLRVP